MGGYWYDTFFTIFQRLRRRIYELVEHPDRLDNENDIASESYDRLMIACIVSSIIPLCFKNSNPVFDGLERVTVDLFIMDYFLRWLTADLKHPQEGAAAFVRYPFTFMAVVDLISVVPSLLILNPGWKVVRLLRLSRSLKFMRLLWYNKGFRVIAIAVKKEKQALTAVMWMAAGYIFLSALVMFSVEPGSFNTFFDAIYWSVVTLTTVGYGDVYPRTEIGRFISMISSLVGIAIVALPTGILTAGFMSELQNHIEDEEE